jgi:hypothetical protein
VQSVAGSRGGKTEDVHEESVGTVRGLQFAPIVAVARQTLPGLRMNFVEALLPAWMVHNRGVALREEVAMQPAVFRGQVTNDWPLTITFAITEF